MYFHTASSGISNIPDIVNFIMVDGIEGGFCDSSGEVKPTLDWTKKLIQDQPEVKELHAQLCIKYINIYRARNENIRKELNQTEGMLL